MSHACCLVILNEDEELEEVMKPFEESPEDEEYLEFEDYTDDVLKEYQDYVREGREEINFAEFLESNGYIEENGRYGYKTNPNGQWDWYEVGGRWSNYLKLKDDIKHPKEIIVSNGKPFEGYETHCDSCMKEDFDYEGMKRQRYENAIKSWEEHEKHPDKDAFWEYGIRKGETKEEYLKRMEKESLFYTILKNGEWNSRGDLGWFGLSGNDDDKWNQFEEKLIKESDNKSRFILIDYHI